MFSDNIHILISSKRKAVKKIISDNCLKKNGLPPKETELASLSNVEWCSVGWIGVQSKT